MSANLCVESHLRHLLEEGFEVVVVRDATAAPLVVAGAYLTALTNYSFLDHAVWLTEETVSQIPEAAPGRSGQAGRGASTAAAVSACAGLRVSDAP
jgi:Isochorismatase family